MVRELGEEEGMIRGREGVERVQGEGGCREGQRVYREGELNLGSPHTTSA